MNDPLTPTNDNAQPQNRGIGYSVALFLFHQIKAVCGAIGSFCTTVASFFKKKEAIMERTVVNVTEQKNLEQILMDPKQIDSDPEKIKDTIVSHIESIDGDTYAAASNAMLSSEVNPSFLSDDDRKITFSFSKGNSDLGVHCKNVENLTVEDLEKKGVFEKNAKVDVIEDLLKETQIGKDFFRAKSATVKIGNTTIEYANDNKNPEVKAETTAKIWQAILDFADEKCSDKLEAERREFILNCIKSFCVSAGQGDTWIPQIINAIPPLNKNEGTYGIITNIAAYSNKITRNISIDENCSKCSVTCEGRTVSTISSYGSNKLEIDSKTVHVPIVVEQTVACTAPFGKPQNRQLDAGGTSLSIYEGIVKSGDNLIESCNPDHRPPAPEIKKGNLIYKVQAAQASPFFDPESIASMTFGND